MTATSHTHTDTHAHVGCPACITAARAAETAAWWADAPLRATTWKAVYRHPDSGGIRTLHFTAYLAVPTGATERLLLDEYADVLSELFVVALPDDVAMHDTWRALDDADFELVHVWADPVLPPSQIAGQLSLIGDTP